MTSTAEPRLEVRTGPRLLLGLTSMGFVLPARRDAGVRHLHAGGVALVAELSRGGTDAAAAVAVASELTGEDADHLRATVEALDERGDLRAGDGPDAGPPSWPVEDVEPDGASVPTGRCQVPTPLTVQPVDGSFRWYEATGRRSVVLTAPETIAASAFVLPRTTEEAHQHLTKAMGPHAPDRATVDRAAALLSLIGIAVPVAGTVATVRAGATTDRLRREELERNRALFREVAADDARRLASAPRTDLVAVVPVAHPVHLPPLSLGLLLAYAKVYRGGRLAERYDLEPRWQVRKESLDRLLEETGPAIFLISQYVWSTEQQLELSRLIKAASPDSLTIHGGPSVPRHPDELATWMAAHPHVDVAVRNEGEATTAEILDVLDGRLAGRADELPSLLSGVAGITYRDGDRLVRTEDRGRFADLDEIPSPYLTGLFGPWERAGVTYMALETNRGCPYGCTFCDWGQVTLSRIRKFDLERIFEEIEWAGRAQAARIQITDSNFGIYARDVEIARKIAEVRERTGAPREVFVSFAKNTMKHITQIVKILVDAGVITTGSISLQTTDPDTLDVVARQNIRTDKYWELAAIFREQRLPLMIDLMLGLPGATPASFDADLQHCVDLEVQPRVYRTEVLVNSPMNDPEYRERHQIRTEDVIADGFDIRSHPRLRKLVLSTDSYTADDLHAMVRFSDSFAIFENYGLVRHAARWVRQTTGITEVDLYHRIDAVVREHPDRYPVLSFVVETVHGHSAVPLRWDVVVDELGRLLVDEIGVPDGTGLETVLAVHRALLPARGRQFPCTVPLPHDHVAWHAEIVAAKERGDLEWCDLVPPLESFGPGELTVDDLDGACDAAIGSNVDAWCGDNWELDSPVSRTALTFRRL